MAVVTGAGLDRLTFIIEAGATRCPRRQTSTDTRFASVPPACGVVALVNTAREPTGVRTDTSARGFEHDLASD
ncbi:hypothetical protein [Mycobacterium sp. 852014-52144_SCH5372336]|uniref:hypothetical protein n=1 Tax=Mycobacterium sp. 852014-52144_SCH5372336 TaxID=1834115 RepID=UPI0012E9346D|nr:hypothetical protein [Mycobacterium sp. 852014-52144_SCH5372336]